jgi:predicted nuclease of predicted toxin-antitoxin system
VKLLIDMNLPPSWVAFLAGQGFESLHWSAVGDPGAPDTLLLAWARDRGYVVLSHDLDFSRLLALTHASGPSVFQVRTEDVLPSKVGTLVTNALRQHAEVLEAGGLVVVDSRSSRARILPL